MKKSNVVPGKQIVYKGEKGTIIRLGEGWNDDTAVVQFDTPQWDNWANNTHVNYFVPYKEITEL